MAADSPMAAWLETCPEPAQPPAPLTSCSRGLYIEKYAYAFGKKNGGEKKERLKKVKKVKIKINASGGREGRRKGQKMKSKLALFSRENNFPKSKRENLHFTPKQCTGALDPWPVHEPLLLTAAPVLGERLLHQLVPAPVVRLHPLSQLLVVPFLLLLPLPDGLATLLQILHTSTWHLSS